MACKGSAVRDRLAPPLFYLNDVFRVTPPAIYGPYSINGRRLRSTLHNCRLVLEQDAL